jgi:hypothetical protein
MGRRSRGQSGRGRGRGGYNNWQPQAPRDRPGAPGAAIARAPHNVYNELGSVQDESQEGTFFLPKVCVWRIYTCLSNNLEQLVCTSVYIFC